MTQKTSLIGKYETLNSVRIGGRDLVLAYGLEGGAYMTFFREFSFTGGFLYADLTISDDYLKVLRIFSRRLRKQIRRVARQRRRVFRCVLTERHCLSDWFHKDLRGRLVILAPSGLAPEYRTSDYQLGFATGGAGCKPESTGGVVHFTELYSGNVSKWDRRNILGIADVKQLPRWAKKKLRDRTRRAKA